MKKRFPIKKGLAAGALVVGLMTVCSLKAGAAPVTSGSIPVANYSFELPAGASSTSPFVSAGNGYTGTRGPNNYIEAYQGNYIGTIGAYPYGAFTTESLSQDISLTSYVPTAGDTLTLSVAGENSQGKTNGGVGGASTPPGNEIALTLGGFVIADNTSIFPVFKFDPITGKQELTLESTAPVTLTALEIADHPGDLGVEVIGTNIQLNIDDIQINVTPSAVIPEPSTWAMLFAGLLSLVGLRRFSRQV